MAAFLAAVLHFARHFQEDFRPIGALLTLPAIATMAVVRQMG
ncbi:hypothetical protein [Sulfitobacter faviae]|nr:hypothetical protein [Sulfitobacter faviae]